MAIEEAFLAEHGFSAVQLNHVNANGQLASDQSVARTYQEVTVSSRDQECQSKFHVRPKSSLIP